MSNDKMRAEFDAAWPEIRRAAAGWGWEGAGWIAWKAASTIQTTEIARLSAELALAEFVGDAIVSIVGERDAARAQLADQTDARNLAITERVEITKYCDDLREQLAQALAAKPAHHHVNGGVKMTRDEAHAMVRTGRPAADLIREAYALGLAQAPSAPEGWHLVPASPDVALEMGWAYLDAARAASPKQRWAFSHAGYRAMIAAAPNPPEGDWTLVRTAAEDAVIVAIEAMVDQQLTASAMSPGDMFRLDGADIWNAAMAAA
jgi:hypothetical protein